MKIMTYKTFKNWFLGAGLGFLIFIFGLIKTKLCSISGAGGFDCIGWVVPILLGMILFVVSLVYSFVNVIILKRNIITLIICI